MESPPRVGQALEDAIAQPRIDPDELIDPRVRNLLYRYVELSGAELREIRGDCYELIVPKEDRPAFEKRRAVRIALSLAAMETEADAEMAVVGSPLVEQLIAAVRRRGTRLLIGDIASTVPAGPAAAVLGTPVINGNAQEPATANARHPVGRLVARVTVRAGTSLNEYLVESSLFDLATGVAMGRDVSDACTTSPIAPLSGGEHSMPEETPRQARAMDELVPMMLADLEHRLAPAVNRQRTEAELALQAELARIDRYYAGVLVDIGGRGTGIPDAAARRAIEAEHGRRRGEEVRRHEVRAAVHPLQLLEWSVPVERAEWSLESADGHKSSLIGQRTLVGSGEWTIGCPQCGLLSPSHLLVCKDNHTACGTCGHLCAVCGTGFCTDHGIAACHVDGQAVCDIHARSCPSCRLPHCTEHAKVCDESGHEACSNCVIPCAHCHRPICDEHALRTGTSSPLGGRRLCAECIVYCEGGTNEPVGVDEVTRCASCDRHVCRNHQAVCAVDGKVHCSTHLRRTDGSSRLLKNGTCQRYETPGERSLLTHVL